MKHPRHKLTFQAGYKLCPTQKFCTAAPEEVSPQPQLLSQNQANITGRMGLGVCIPNLPSIGAVRLVSWLCVFKQVRFLGRGADLKSELLASPTTPSAFVPAGLQICSHSPAVAGLKLLTYQGFLFGNETSSVCVGKEK